MLKDKKSLGFYFITDDMAPYLSPAEQVQMALSGGATMIQYRNKAYTADFLEEVVQIREICRENGIPFLINDHVELAVQVMADGVHVGQEDDSPALARKRLGDTAIIGVSVSSLGELEHTDLSVCDYIGTGPFFPTGTKADASSVLGPEKFREIADRSPVPVVAIGGITPENARLCFESGADGVAVISCISRVQTPLINARKLCCLFKEITQ